MTIKISFLAQRPNTSTDFWWESTDPSIAEICNDIKALATNVGITHSASKSGDGLSYTSDFTAPNRTVWLSFMDALTRIHPTMLSLRNSYNSQANHSLVMSVKDLDADSVVHVGAPTYDRTAFQDTLHVWAEPDAGTPSPG